MNELIRITEHEGMQAVNARELHAFLGNKQEFSNWFKNRKVKYELIENEDFVRLTNLSSEGRGGQNKVEYALTVDCAKELSMVEGTEKGKQARRYFIDRDKALRGLEEERVRVLSEKTNYRQLRRMAGELVVNEGLSQREACEVLGVSERFIL